jgi:hypothetical protein
VRIFCAYKPFTSISLASISSRSQYVEIQKNKYTQNKPETSDPDSECELKQHTILSLKHSKIELRLSLITYEWREKMKRCMGERET